MSSISNLCDITTYNKNPQFLNKSNIYYVNSNSYSFLKNPIKTGGKTMSEETYLRDGSGTQGIKEEGQSKLLRIHELLKALYKNSNRNVELSQKIKLGLFGPEIEIKTEKSPDANKDPDISNTLDGALRRLIILNGILSLNERILCQILKEL